MSNNEATDAKLDISEPERLAKEQIDPIGYASPPVKNQFPPKTSGNPNGRPKGRRSFKTEVREILDLKIGVSDNGRNRKVTVSQAALMRLRQRALAGDARAADRLLALAQIHLPPEPPGNIEQLLDEDAQILTAYRERLLVKVQDDE